MINKTHFTNWQTKPESQLRLFNKASANLVLIQADLIKRFGGAGNGIYGIRDIHGGTSLSSHAFGAALDWSYRGMYDNKNVQAGRDVAKLVSQWLIDNSKELGVQAIHDYINCRIWRSNRATDSNGGWRIQAKSTTGMGQTWGNWLHIEVHEQAWAWNTPIEQRLAPVPDPVPQRPVLYYGMPTSYLVGAVQQILRDKCSQDIGPDDGNFGMRTLTGYRNFRAYITGQGHPITQDDRIDTVDWDYLAIADGGWARLYNAGFPH